jgi:2-dehydro-3-deoxygluconokinase
MKIICFGECLLRLGAPGRELLLQSPRFDVHVGGAEANVAVSLARFGHAVSMVGTLPAGPLGDAAGGFLRLHGVDTSRLRIGEGRMGLYFLQTGAGARPSEVLYDRAGSAFARCEASAYDWPRLLEGADWLHLSGVTPALGQGPADIAIEAVRAARKAGVRVSFDGNYRQRLWQAWSGDAPGILRQIMAEADLVFADHRDIALVLEREFAGDDHATLAAKGAAAAFDAFPRLARMACTLRVQHSVETHGLAAALFRRDQPALSVEERELTGIVDRIGAGDAFAAGLLHALNWPDGDETQALRFALAAACLKHSIPGDANPLGEADIRACMQQGRLDVRR